jgi:hypothetical protein
MTAFETLLSLGTEHKPTRYNRIWARDCSPPYREISVWTRSGICEFVRTQQTRTGAAEWKLVHPAICYSVLRNAIRSFRSDESSRSPKRWPGVDRACPSWPLKPVGTYPGSSRAGSNQSSSVAA